MTRIFFTLLISALAAFSSASAQSASGENGDIVVHKDPRIDLLINKQIEINEFTTRHSRRNIPGYRILVVSSNNRDNVTQAKTTIYKSFPELKAYMMYQAPFFRLKVGNFRERYEAEEYVGDIQRLFKGSVYVVPDTIEIRPDLDEH